MSTWDGPQKSPASEPNYTKAIPIHELQKVISPFSWYLKYILAAAATGFLMYYIPAWRWKWRQRKIFNKYVAGRTIDLVPSIGEERWQKLYLDYSSAVVVDLVGRRLETAESAAAANSGEPVDDRPKAPNPIRKAKSYGYQIQQEQIRDAEMQKSTQEEAIEVLYDLVEDACMPDTPLGVSDITFRPADVMKLNQNYYDTAVIFNALCWEEVASAENRIKMAWGLVKPGGVLVIIDYGRPYYKPLQKLVDWIESFQKTSLRLTLDHVEFVKENLTDAEWPPMDLKRYWLGARYSMVVQKKYPEGKSTEKK